VASHCNEWELCGVVILRCEGWRRGSSQVTLRFLVFVVSCVVLGIVVLLAVTRRVEDLPYT